jgi:hypothetical protein
VESAVIHAVFADAEQERKRRQDLRAQDRLALCHLPHPHHPMRAVFEAEIRARESVRAPEVVVAVEAEVVAEQQREVAAEVAVAQKAGRRTALSLNP